MPRINIYLLLVMILPIFSCNKTTHPDKKIALVGKLDNLQFGNEILYFNHLGTKTIEVDSLGNFRLDELPVNTIQTIRVNSQYIDFFINEDSRKDTLVIDAFKAINNLKDVYNGIKFNYKNETLAEIQKVLTIYKTDKIELLKLSLEEFNTKIKELENDANQVLIKSDNFENDKDISIIENYIYFTLLNLSDYYTRGLKKQNRYVGQLEVQKNRKVQSNLLSSAFYTSYLVQYFNSQYSIDSIDNYQKLEESVNTLFQEFQERDYILYYSFLKKYYSHDIPIFKAWINSYDFENDEYNEALDEYRKKIDSEDFLMVMRETLLLNSAGKTDSIILEPNTAYFIDFWATWCIPCKEEKKYLDKIQHELESKDIKVIALSMDKNQKAWLKAVDKETNTLVEHYLVAENFKSNLSDNININALPRFLVVKDGLITSYDAMRPSNEDFFDQF